MHYWVKAVWEPCIVLTRNGLIEKSLSKSSFHNWLRTQNIRSVSSVRPGWRLEHTHIVPVYDYGTENGISYIVMRLLHEGSIQERVIRSAPQVGWICMRWTGSPPTSLARFNMPMTAV